MQDGVDGAVHDCNSASDDKVFRQSRVIIEISIDRQMQKGTDSNDEWFLNAINDFLKET